MFFIALFPESGRFDYRHEPRPGYAICRSGSARSAKTYGKEFP